MADEHQTSSEITGNLNPEERVIARGEVTFAVDDPTGSYYTGQGQVDLDFVRASVANPTFEFYRYVDNGAPTYSRSLSKGGGPVFSFVSGDITYIDSGFLFWVQDVIDPDDDKLKLLISARSITNTPAVRYFYIVKALSITNSDVFA